MKTEIAKLQNKIKVTELNKNISKISLVQDNNDQNTILNDEKNHKESSDLIQDLNTKIQLLECQCHNLEQELCAKQVELSSFEEIIVIRDSLCKDLQDKLTSVETCLEETIQRLEMVKGHHALALEANESIRKEYRTELEALKLKVEEEKQAIVIKSRTELENIKTKYNNEISLMKLNYENERQDIVNDFQKQLSIKDNEMKAKLEQIDEATHEKLRLCDIQFEERLTNIQEHCSQQEDKIQYLDKECNELKSVINLAEETKVILQNEISYLKNENECLHKEKLKLQKEIEDVKNDSKRKFIDLENEINKLTTDVENVLKEKNKFEMSLSVTRDIVQVLTMRLRDSDNELEHLEDKIKTLTNNNDVLEKELTSYKSTLKNTVLECNEYKESLLNILKSKAALAKEHNRIMEHNVTLIESLQNVEKEAYRELGSIKNELIEDVELVKKESNTQIKLLREEVSFIIL